MNIALDIDGVIIDFVSSFISLAEKRFDQPIKYEDIYCHDISQALALPKKDLYSLFHETLFRNHFRLIDGALDGITALNKDHNIYLITSRHERYKKSTMQLLDNHRISYNDIYFSQFMKKHQVDIHFDVFVEDCVDEAVNLSQRNCQVLLYNQPWNTRCLNMKNLFKRVYNWDDIIKEVESINQKQLYLS